MSSETLEMDWLNPAGLKSPAARRFAEFCLQSPADPDTVAEASGAGSTPDEQALYKEAVLLVLGRLEQGLPAGRRT